MTMPKLFPQTFQYMFWERKEKFLLYEAQYEHWTIFAVESGSFYFEIGDIQGTASLGDLVIGPPGVPFRRVVIAPLTFHNIKVRWVDATETEQDVCCPDSPIPSGKISIREIERLTANYGQMKQLERKREPAALRRLNHCMQDIWYMYEDEGNAADTDPLQTDGREDPLMARAAQQIRSRAYGPLQLKDLAVELKLAPALFTKHFKSAYGETPVQYLTSLRLEKARTLLLETEMTLNEIAECCGYQNGYYLNRIFVKHVGVSPGKFRKTHQV